jgi:hypothetical protein
MIGGKYGQMTSNSDLVAYLRGYLKGYDGRKVSVGLHWYFLLNMKVKPRFVVGHDAGRIRGFS